MQRLLKTFFYTVGIVAVAFAVSWVIYMPSSQERGVWRAETGGSILQLSALKATLYSESAHSCYPVISFPAHMKLIELAEGATVEVQDGQLNLAVDGSLDARNFDPVDTLPEACGDVDPSNATALDVFDAAWAAMDEHYAFFDLHGVDWAARKDLAPAPDAQMSDAEIDEMLLAMMAGLDDGHVHFGSDERGYSSPSERPVWIPEDDSLSRDILRDVALSNSGAPLTQSPDAPIIYGLRTDGVGYIMIREMDVAVPFGSNSRDAMADAFGAVLTDLATAKALIIDVRYNPGGSDTVSFGVAGHFIDAPLPVFTKSTRVGDSQAAPFTATLTPVTTTKDMRPVVLMTSKLTGSAAEILTLAMREIPNVTTLGEPTSGGLSDVMGFVLPNGWGLGLSNQTYLSMDGDLYEAVGIPPDIPVAFETAPFLASQDPVLAAAIVTARNLTGN